MKPDTHPTNFNEQRINTGLLAQLIYRFKKLLIKQEQTHDISVCPHQKSHPTKNSRCVFCFQICKCWYSTWL